MYPLRSSSCKSTKRRNYSFTKNEHQRGISTPLSNLRYSATKIYSTADSNQQENFKKKTLKNNSNDNVNDTNGKVDRENTNAQSVTESANTILLVEDDNADQGPLNTIFFEDDEGLQEQQQRFQPFTFSTGPLTQIEDHFQDKGKMREKLINDIILSIPIVIPFMAFEFYEEVAYWFNAIINFLTIDRTWSPVDGGQYQAQIITPAVNGIVVPAISILFATLIANTVSTLRQRQLDIRLCINREAGDLRLLSGMVDSFPNSYQKEKCHSYLTQYTSRVISECQAGVKINSLEISGSLDSEMNGFLNTLNDLAMAKKTNITPPDTVLSESYGAVIRLNSDRSARITAMQTTFPMLHYGILTALGASIAMTFLIESNQEILVFLNALQLKILWAMLCGTFAALATVCYDLGDPFRGSYQISNAVFQLFTIRDVLKASCAELCETD